MVTIKDIDNFREVKYLKTFLKIFIISFIVFVFTSYLGGYTYIKKNNIALENNVGFGFSESKDLKDEIFVKLETTPKEPKSFSTLSEAFEKSSRVNFLVLGMEGTRSDTIIFSSFDPESKKINLISIPRDTYIHRKGFNGAEDRKINSIFINHDVEGVQKTVSYILEGAPIHHYVLLDYEGVKKIVDILGGVEVDVPFHMKYRDPTADPPLNIDIKEGKQVLYGKDALDFVRYRKGNNKKGYIDGDLGRIRAQQQFLTAFSAKAKEKILTVFTKGFEFVKTDVSIFDALSLGRKAIGISSEDINFHTIPGKADYRKINKKVLSYFIYNSKDVITQLEGIYNVKKNSEQ